MRLFCFILALAGLVSFSGCDDFGHFPAVPVTLTLNKDYKFLSAGTHQLLLSMPSNARPDFVLVTADTKREFLSLPSEGLLEEIDYANRDWADSLTGITADGAVVEGIFVATKVRGGICGAPNSAGHRSCIDPKLYKFIKGDLRRGNDVLGTIKGHVLVDDDLNVVESDIKIDDDTE